MSSRVDTILRDAATRIGSQTSCSVILRHAGGLTRVASSDERSASCDEVEVSERGGPCVLAMDQLSGVLVPDLGADERWPIWRDRAVAVGFHSAAALPAYVGDGAVLALNLYSDLLDPWDGDALVRADVQVQEIAGLLADDQR
jgi:hypothetical protein